MANRFIRLIEEGAVASEGELKSAFRAFARATHPDLGAAGSRPEDFIKARAEYEAAVRYLAPKASQDEGGCAEASAGRAAGGGTRGRFDRDLFYADLEALLKAGFPKTARHDKERRKYARLRLRVRSALAGWDDDGGSRLADFDAFERWLAAIRDGRDSGAGRLADEALGLVEGVIDYAESGIVPLRASIEIEFAALRAAVSGDAALADGVTGFLGALIGDLDGGPALG